MSCQQATSSKRKLVDNDESKESTSKSCRINSACKILDKPNEYPSSGLKNTLHGSIYQLKLLMWFARTGVKNNYQFRLATEMDTAEKFDGLVLQFKPKGQDRIAHRFLQAKHKQDESKKITYKDLLSQNDGDFSLPKYFKSFRRIKQNLEFEVNFEIFICTNINLDLVQLDQKKIKTKEITETDDFFPSFKAQEKLAARYKLILGEKHELYEKLKETSDIHMLAKELFIGIKDKKQLNLNSFIIKSYHYALVKENIMVIEQTNKEYIGKFNDKFIKYNFKYPNDPKNDTGISESAKKLRNILQKYLEINGLSLDKDTELKLSSTFGKGLDSDPQLNNIQEFTNGMVKLVKGATNYVIIISAKCCGKAFEKIAVKAIEYNINKLAGHVLVIEDKKIQFIKSFFDDNIKLPGNLEEFKSNLKNDLKKEGKNLNDLSRYQLEIDRDFIKFEEEKLHTKTSLPNDNIEDREITEFFQKLVLAVSQPNEIQLSNIIKEEMDVNFKINLLDDISLVTDSFEIKMLDWFKSKGQEKGKEGTWLSHQDVKGFFNSIELQVNSFTALGICTSYIAKLEGYGIEFKREYPALKDFLSTNDSTQILNLIYSTETFLGAINVLQTLEYADLREIYKRKDSYIFMPLEEVIQPKIQQIVLEVFESSITHNLLVIDCYSKVTKPNILKCYRELSKIINNSTDHIKKIILITKENDTLAEEFENNYTDKYKKLERDYNTRFTDLTQSSQNKLFRKPVVVFQGKNISFNKLIGRCDENIKKIIDTETLVKLIKDEEVKIGNKLKDLGKINDYYIPRRMHTQVIFNMESIKKDIKKICLKDFLVISGTASGLAVPNQIFVFDKSNDELASIKFRELCEQNTKSNIHWLKCYSEKLILHESQGSIVSLVNHREMDMSANTYNKTSNNGLIENEYLKLHKSKIVIIADTAGKGKSTLLTSLSMKIKKNDPSLLVIRIDLNDYTSVLAQEVKTRTILPNTHVNVVVDFLLNNLLELPKQSKLTTTLEKELFKRCIDSQGKMALLFDGFDEISPDYKDVVIDILQALKKTKIKKLFVTTRPNMRPLLEEKLNVFSDIIEPFSKQNQEEFLIKFWIKKLNMKDLNQESKNRLKTYADSLVTKFSASINDKIQEFIGIPLQTVMLAEIFYENGKQEKFGEWEGCKEFIASDNTKIKPNLPEKFELLSLYEHFVKEKYYNFHLEAKQHADLTNVFAKTNEEENFNKFIKRHSIVALSVFLDDKELNKLLSETERQQLDSCIKDIENVEKNEGIIDKIIDNKPHFIHRTFAEYFASFVLVEKMSKKPQTVCSIVNTIIVNASPVFISRIAKYHNNLGKSVLHYAIEYNRKNIVDSVLNYHNDKENSNIVEFLNKKDNQGKTALDYAEHSKLDMELSLLLLLKGANIDGLTREYKKKLTHYMLFSHSYNKLNDGDLLCAYAHENNKYRPIEEKLLMACPEEFSELENEYQKYQSRLLSYFFVHGRIKVIETLLISITDEERRNFLLNADENGFTPLDRVNSSDQISDDERLKITKYLLENGGIEVRKVIGLSDKSSNSYITAILQAAVQVGHIKTFKYFLHKEKYTYYSLHFSLAVKNQQFNIIKYLMENHRSYIKDKGNTPLHIAVKYEGSLKIIKYCIDKGGDIITQNDKGETPLFYAIYKRRLNVLKYLVERGADVNIVDKQGLTALNHAIENDQRDIINYLLLECKANVNFTSELIADKIDFFKNSNEFNLTLTDLDDMQFCLFSAIQLNQLEWAKFLIHHDADVNIKDRNGRTPLHWAAELQQTEIVETLLQYGAIFDAKDNNNITPLDLAAQSDCNKIAWLLNLLKKLFSSQNLMQDFNEQLLNIEINKHLKDWGPYGLGHPEVWSSDNPFLFILNGKNAEGNTLLHRAAETNDLKALNILLEFNYEYIGRREHPQCETDRRYKYYESILIDAIDSLGNTPLHLASEKGHEKVVELLLKEGAIFNTENHQERTPEDLAKNNHHDNITRMMQSIQNLFIAIEQRNINAIWKYSKKDAYYINAKNRIGETPLHFAISSDHSDIVLHLLNRGANTEALDMHNQTPLHLATANNKIDIVKLLLKHGAIFNSKDKWNKSPYEFKNNESVNLLNAIKKLFSYVQSDNPEEIIDYIKVIEKNFKLHIGTIFNIRDNQCNTFLHYAAKLNDIEIVKFLFKNDAVSHAQDKIKEMSENFRYCKNIFVLLGSIEKTFRIVDYISKENKAVNRKIYKDVSNHQCTLIHMAAEYDKLYLVQQLVRAGGDVDLFDKDGKSPFYSCVEKGKLELAKFLIEHGADVNYLDRDNKSPLYSCVEKGMLESAKFLIEHEAYVDLIEKDDKTPLYCAVENGMLDLAKLLIENGANVSYVNKYGKTILHYCIETDKLDLAKFLIKHGATINCSSIFGNLSRSCVEKSLLEYAKFYIEFGGNVNRYYGSRYCPALHTCALGMLELAKFLIEHDADVNYKDVDGQTPLHISAKEGMLDLAKLLIEHGADVKSKNVYGVTPLHTSAQKGMLDLAKLLIEHDADANSKDVDGETPLHISAKEGMLDLAKLLIEHGADVKSKDVYGVTPLHTSAQKGMLDLAKLLIEHDADVNSKDVYGQTPLHISAEEGMLDLAKLLIEHGADVNSKDVYGITPLYNSAQKGMLDLAKLLIEHSADVNSKNEDGNTPLHSSAQEGRLNLAKLLIEHDLNVNCINKYGETPLHYCAEKGMLDLAKLLIEHGADVKSKDVYGVTPLHTSAQKGMLDLAKLLIEHDADVNSKDVYGQTPLHISAEEGMLDLAKLLIEHGADVNSKDVYGITPLYNSAQKGMLDLAKLLIEHSADVNSKNEDGNTPLHSSAQEGRLNLAKLLIEHDLNVNCINKYGETPLHYCAEKGMLDLAGLLIEHDADVNSKDNDGETPLHISAQGGMLHLAKFLIEHDADVNSKDVYGITPLHSSVEKGMLDLAKLLIEHGADVNSKNEDGNTPLHSSAQEGMLDLAKLLIEHDLNVNCINKYGKTPLHYCAEKGMLDLGKFLIEHDADVNSKDVYADTPLHRSVEKGMLDFAKFLIDQGADINCINLDDKTALHYCAEKGLLDFAKFLIDHGGNIRLEDKNRKTALQIFSEFKRRLSILTQSMN